VGAFIHVPLSKGNQRAQNGDKVRERIEMMKRVDSWMLIGSSVQKTVRVDKALLSGLKYGNALILRNCPRAGGE
jgi:hypothetical protein